MTPTHEPPEREIRYVTSEEMLQLAAPIAHYLGYQIIEPEDPRADLIERCDACGEVIPFDTETVTTPDAETYHPSCYDELVPPEPLPDEAWVNDSLVGWNAHLGVGPATIRWTDRQSAYRAAAWIVSLADTLPQTGDDYTFEAILAAARGS